MKSTITKLTTYSGDVWKIVGISHAMLSSRHKSTSCLLPLVNGKTPGPEGKTLDWPEIIKQVLSACP